MDSIQEWAASSHWMILFRMSQGDQFVPVEVCFEIAILTPCSQDLVGVAGNVDAALCSPASWTQPVRKHIQKPSRFKSPETVESEGLVLDFQEQPTLTTKTVSSFRNFNGLLA